MYVQIRWRYGIYYSIFRKNITIKYNNKNDKVFQIFLGRVISNTRNINLLMRRSLAIYHTAALIYFLFGVVLNKTLRHKMILHWYINISHICIKKYTKAKYMHRYLKAYYCVLGYYIIITRNNSKRQQQIIDANRIEEPRTNILYYSKQVA